GNPELVRPGCGVVGVEHGGYAELVPLLLQKLCGGGVSCGARVVDEVELELLAVLLAKAVGAERPACLIEELAGTVEVEVGQLPVRLLRNAQQRRLGHE